LRSKTDNHNLAGLTQVCFVHHHKTQVVYIHYYYPFPTETKTKGEINMKDERIKRVWRLPIFKEFKWYPKLSLPIWKGEEE